EAGDEQDEAGADAFVKDFEVQLAHDVLVQAGGATAAGEVMKRAEGLFKRHAGEQEARIATEFTKLGLDWSEGPKKGMPRAELSFGNQAGDRPAVAGQELVLTATVTNTGDAPLYRVYGVTDSDNPLL